MDIDESTTQWRARWTDPSGERALTKQTKAMAQAVVDRQAQWGAVLESREITVGDWELVDG